MAFAANFRRMGEAVLATGATALLLYFGNGMNPIWPLVWIAPLPLLVFALRSSWYSTAVVTIAAMLLGSLNMWSYLTHTLGAPTSAFLSIFFVASCLFALGVLLFRTLVLRGAVWSGLVALPSLWVAIEYIRNITTPHGSAGSLAYSQLSFLPFLQLASITGPWGMTFVLLLFPSTVAIGLHLGRTSLRKALRVFAAGGGIVIAVLAYGAIRLMSTPTQTAKIGLITSDLKLNVPVADPGADTERLFRDYVLEAEKLAASGAQAIVMPEKLGVTLEGKSAETDKLLQGLADRTGATIVAGVVHVDGPAKFNETRIYSPRSTVLRYDKEHMLPPFESNLKPGTTLVTLARPRQEWGVAICKDMDFAAPARLYGKAGVGLLLVPGWDFVVDGSWHGHIAIMRGVEDGFSVARAAKNGFLTVSDSRGRIVGEVSSSSAPFATLLVDVPADHSRTIYQILGDWFVWAAMVLLTAALIQTARPKQRT